MMNVALPAFLEEALHSCFEWQAEQIPTHIAIRSGERYLSYQELNTQANQLAHLLKASGVGPEILVGLCMKDTFDNLIGLLGILKAGGAYVPLDLSAPRERLAFILQDTCPAVLLTEESALTSLPPYDGSVLCYDRASPLLKLQSKQAPHLEGTADSLACVLYTSGSTGRPKGVLVHHRGISRMARDANFRHIEPSDRVVLGSNLCFDGSLFEMWVAWLNGAELVVVPKETMLSPLDLAVLLQRERISMLFLTTSLFHLIAQEVPGAFRFLKVLYFGGEMAYPHCIRAVLEHDPPQKLLHLYGPTECSVIATAYPIKTLSAEASTVPIGFPISLTEVCLLDERLEPVADGLEGEICLGGRGLARGYLNRPDETQERFIAHPFSALPGARLYRTGDYGYRHADGTLEFLGRKDNQIKLNGFRIELDELEAVLNQYPAIQQAVILLREVSVLHKHLVAYVQWRAPAYNNLKGLQRHLAERLPSYMIPTIWQTLSRFPLNANGKVDRQALQGLALRRQDLQSPFVAPRNEQEALMTHRWAQVLQRTDIGVEDDFFALGGTSLLAAHVLLHLQRDLHRSIPIAWLFEFPTISGLVQHLQRQPPLPQRPRTFRRAEESVLDESIRPQGALRGDMSAPSSLLVTGATGFLGAFVVAELLKSTEASVYCLIRCRSEEEGTQRLQQALQDAEIWQAAFRDRLVVVPGDLSKPFLGGSQERFEELARRLDGIYHCGAEVNFVKSYAHHRPANVFGTQEVLRLAASSEHLIPLYAISTLAVFGPVGSLMGITSVGEDASPSLSETVLEFDLGYSQSKWVAEKLLLEAKARGMPISLFRLGAIMGHSQTGISNMKDFASLLIKGCIQLGSYPNLPNQRKDFVPVDFASKAIVALSRQRASLNKVFHIVPPLARNIQVTDFFELFASLGYQMQRLSYSRWTEALVAQLQDHENALLGLLPLLTEKVYQDRLTLWELYENMPEYDCQNMLEGLSTTGLSCPQMDAALLRIYLTSFRERGFLPDPLPVSGQ